MMITTTIATINIIEWQNAKVKTFATSNYNLWRYAKSRKEIKIMCDKSEPTIDRLRKLIDDCGKTRQQIAKDLKCDTSTITKHYNGDRGINADFIVKYAKYFNVSADYLLGLSKTPSTDKDIKGVCDYTGLSKEAINKIVELKKENTDYLNNGIFNTNAFVDFNTTNFINEFIANGELYYMSLLANDIILKNYLILSIYTSAIDKISKGENIDYKKVENEIETAIENKDLSTFRIQRAILNFFDDITSDIQDKVNKAEKAFNEIKRLYNGNNTQEE